MGNAGRAIGQSHYRFCEGIQTARREKWTLLLPSDTRLNLWLYKVRTGPITPTPWPVGPNI